MPHAPLPLPSVLFAPQHPHSASLFYAGPHTPFPPPAVASQHAQCLFLVQGSHPLLGRPSPPPTCSALRHARVQVQARTRPQRNAPHLHARKHARTRTHGRPTNEQCDVRSTSVAGWITARGGNTERTLTAAAGPSSPRDPYRHALAMRPPRKTRPFVFLKLPLKSPPLVALPPAAGLSALPLGVVFCCCGGLLAGVLVFNKPCTSPALALHSRRNFLCFHADLPGFGFA